MRHVTCSITKWENDEMSRSPDVGSRLVSLNDDKRDVRSDNGGYKNEL